MDKSFRPSNRLVTVSILLVSVFGLSLLLPSSSTGQVGEPATVVRFQRAPTRGADVELSEPPGADVPRFRRASTRVPTPSAPDTSTAIVRFERAPTHMATRAPTATATAATPLATSTLLATATTEIVQFQRRPSRVDKADSVRLKQNRFVRSTRAAPDPIVEYVPPLQQAHRTPQLALVPPVISLAPGQEFQFNQRIVIIGTGNPNAELQIVINDAVVDTTTVDEDGVWGWRFQPDGAGTYEISVIDISRVFSETSEPVRISVIARAD